MKSRQLISSLSCSFQCPEMLMTSPCISFQSVQWGMDTQPEDPAENVRPTDTKTQQGILPALTAHLVPVWNQLDRLQSQTVVCTWIFTFAMIDWLCLSRQSCHRDTFSAHEIQTHWKCILFVHFQCVMQDIRALHQTVKNVQLILSTQHQVAPVRIVQVVPQQEAQQDQQTVSSEVRKYHTKTRTHKQQRYTMSQWSGVALRDKGNWMVLAISMSTLSFLLPACSVPGNVPNAQRERKSPPYLVGTTIAYTCDECFTGDGTITCEPSRRWSQLPTCTSEPDCNF